VQHKVILRCISTYPFSMANVPAIAVPPASRRDCPVLKDRREAFVRWTVFRVGHAFERDCVHTSHPDLTKLAPLPFQDADHEATPTHASACCSVASRFLKRSR